MIWLLIQFNSIIFIIPQTYPNWEFLILKDIEWHFLSDCLTLAIVFAFSCLKFFNFHVNRRRFMKLLNTTTNCLIQWKLIYCWKQLDTIPEVITLECVTHSRMSIFYKVNNIVISIYIKWYAISNFETGTKTYWNARILNLNTESKNAMSSMSIPEI